MQAGGALIGMVYPIFGLSKGDLEEDDDEFTSLGLLASFLLMPITIPITTIGGIGYGIFKRIKYLYVI